MERLAEPKADHLERRRLRIGGIVQGVGFRPLVYRLAVACGLSGFVCNQRGEVLVEVEGSMAQVDRFIEALWHEARPPARIERYDEERVALAGSGEFRIALSAEEGDLTPAFPPDLAICPDCRADLLHPAGRFFGYPFTSCTYCGPRYSMIEGLPYDRPTTAMAPFPLCDACLAEYRDPVNRRFHAQSLACPACGPQVALVGDDGPEGRMPGALDWRGALHELLRAGGIAAVKGIGGFHLICDAGSAEAVRTLRLRKRRPRKPFALMARDLESVERHFELSPVEREALISPRAPILLLRPKPELRLPLALLAPGLQRVGLMLAYSPLHLLLFPAESPFLVATSGNQSGLPIARTNEEALAQLSQIADRLLLHNREIVVRVEDSVGQVVGERLRLIRRSRGYVPEAIRVPVPPEGPVVLAVGAEQKSTVCLLQGDRALLSPHHGDLDGEEQLAIWREGVRHQTGLLGVQPDLIAFDPHPHYLVSQEAARLFPGKAMAPVYHHHAHMAATMAEHGLTGPVIGCILDGTGYGPDGTLWGFEILAGDYVTFERIAHLKPIKLPGGEMAIRQPWLVAVSLGHEARGYVESWAAERFPDRRGDLPLVIAQLDGRIPAPKASSAGRLFDGVAALLGLCTESTYEGEAAILLGELAEAYERRSALALPGERASDRARAAGVATGAPPESYPFSLDDGLLQTGPLIDGLLEDLERSVPAGRIALRFHQTVAAMVCAGARQARERTGLTTVVLGGGVWQNRTLLTQTERLLTEAGFTVYSPAQVPAGDGGIALGQAMIARWRWHQDVLGGTSKGD